MPTYEYACDSCERRFDVFQRFEEEPLQVCEVCGGSLRRVFHPVGVLFKGSGFYSTDSKASSKGGSGSSKASEGADQKSSKGSSDSSTAEKSGEGGSTQGSGSDQKAGAKDKSGDTRTSGSAAKSRSEGS